MKLDARVNQATRDVLSAQSGDTIIVRRREGQTHTQFVSAISAARAKWKKTYGVHTSSSFAGDTCSVYIIRGLDKSSAAVADMLDRKSVRAAVRLQSPAAAPAPPPVFTTADDEAREFWKAMFLESVKAMPSSGPEVHKQRASEAVEAYARQWGV